MKRVFAYPSLFRTGAELAGLPRAENNNPLCHKADPVGENNLILLHPTASELSINNFAFSPSQPSYEERRMHPTEIGGSKSLLLKKIN